MRKKKKKAVTPNPIVNAAFVVLIVFLALKIAIA